jgi:hypothetical protein
MTMRRQALHSSKPLVTASFLSLFFALPSLLANTQDAQPIKVAYVQPGALLFTILSAVTLVMWRYHRRDYASPRRTGRGI